MEDVVARYLSQALTGYSILAVLLVFAGGIVTSIGPCNMSMIPVLMAYVGGTSDVSRARSFWLSLFFTLGTSTTFALLGVIASVIGGFFGISKSILVYIAAVVSIMVGLKMAGLIKFNLPNYGTRILRRPQHRGIWPAFLMGLVIGLAGSQCATPILFAILSLVMSKGQIAYGAALLFLYGLGRGVPVIAAGTFTGFAKGLPGLTQWAGVFEKAAGVVLILIGLYFAWTA